MGFVRGACALGLLLAGGCAAIAGIDHSYELDDGEGGGAPGGAGGSTATATASGSTTSGVGGAGGGAAGGGGVGPEVCIDGVDNDKNGDIDCADLANCAATVECVPELPAGFKGYVRYHGEAYTGNMLTPPTCPDGSQPTRYFEGPGSLATCSQCMCDWPGAACSAPKIECFQGNLTCVGAADFTQTAQNENCISLMGFSSSGQDESCLIAGPAVVTNPGACATSGGGAIVDSKWKVEIFVCALESVGGGCMAGEACAPRPAGNYEGLLCIQATGVVDCPTGWKSEQRTVYSGGNDTRGCSSCTCTSGVSCGNDGYYTAYGDNICGGAGVVVNGACTGAVAGPLGSNGSVKPKLSSVVKGQCGGGQPTGAVETTGPITICCR